MKDFDGGFSRLWMFFNLLFVSVSIILTGCGGDSSSDSKVSVNSQSYDVVLQAQSVNDSYELPEKNIGPFGDYYVDSYDRVFGYQNSDVVYLIRGGTIFVSTDFGKTYIPIININSYYNRFILNPNDPSKFIVYDNGNLTFFSDFGKYKVRETKLYINNCKIAYNNENIVYCLIDEKLFISNNYGEKFNKIDLVEELWSNYNRPGDTTRYSYYVYNIYTDLNNPYILYANVYYNGYRFIKIDTTPSKKLEIKTMGEGLDASYNYTFVQNPKNSSEFFAYLRGSSKLYKSTDGGLTFKEVGFSGEYIYKVIVDGSNVAVATNNGLKYSSDGGITYTILYAGTVYDFYTKDFKNYIINSGILFNAETKSSEYTFGRNVEYISTSGNISLYKVSYSDYRIGIIDVNGKYTATNVKCDGFIDMGNSFICKIWSDIYKYNTSDLKGSKIASVFPYRGMSYYNGNLYALHTHYLYMLDLDGKVKKSWKLDRSYTYGYPVVYGNSLFLVNSGTLYKAQLDEDISTITPVKTAISDNKDINDIEIDGSNVLVGGGSGLYISYDGGSTFSQITSIPGNVWSIKVISPGNYLLVSNGKLYESNDGGKTWKQVNFLNPYINSNINDATKINDEYYLATSFGVIKTKAVYPPPSPVNLLPVSGVKFPVNSELNLSWSYKGAGTPVFTVYMKKPNENSFSVVSQCANINTNVCNIPKSQTGNSGVYYWYVEVKDTNTNLTAKSSVQAIQLSSDYTKIFNDVQPGTLSELLYPSIYTLYTYGITKGCGNGNFCGENNVTRAEMATFLVRSVLLDDNFNYNSLQKFKDVSSKDWYFKYVQKLSEIFEAVGEKLGYPDGTFKPNDPVTREQMAKFLIVAKAYLEGKKSVNDFIGNCNQYPSDIAEWSKPYVCAMYKYRYTSGCDSKGNYCGSAPVTRAAMAKFISNALLNR